MQEVVNETLYRPFWKYALEPLQHYRSARDDVTQMLKRGGGDGGAGSGQQHGGRRLAAVEQWARQSSTAGSAQPPSRGMIRRGSDSSGIGAAAVEAAVKGRRGVNPGGADSILKKSPANAALPHSPATAAAAASPPPSSARSASSQGTAVASSSARTTPAAIAASKSESSSGDIPGEKFDVIRK